MASGYKVYIPNGTSAVFSLHDGQTWEEVVNEYLIPSWLDYCNNNWLSVNHENMYCGERKVKSFLNQCGYLLGLSSPGSIESEYKRMKHEVTEIPISSAPQAVNDAFYSAQVPPRVSEEDDDRQYQTMIDMLEDRSVHPTRMAVHNNKYETKFTKIKRLIDQHPGCKITAAIVNTDGIFEYNDEKYMVDPSEQKYQPIKNQDGEEVYIMDTVTVLDDMGNMSVFDMNMDEIKWAAIEPKH